MINKMFFGKPIQFELTWGHIDSKTKEDKDGSDCFESSDSEDDSSTSLIQGLITKYFGIMNCR